MGFFFVRGIPIGLFSLALIISNNISTFAIIQLTHNCFKDMNLFLITMNVSWPGLGHMFSINNQNKLNTQHESRINIHSWQTKKEKGIFKVRNAREERRDEQKRTKVITITAPLGVVSFGDVNYFLIRMTDFGAKNCVFAFQTLSLHISVLFGVGTWNFKTNCVINTHSKGLKSKCR